MFQRLLEKSARSQAYLLMTGTIWPLGPMGLAGLVGLVGLGGLGVMTGCNVEPSVAPSSLVTAETLQTFPKESIRLTSTRIFLWPEAYDDELVSQVLIAGNSMDKLEAESVRWNQQKAEAIQRVERIEETKKTEIKNLYRKRFELNQNKRKLKDQEEIDSIENELKQIDEQLNELKKPQSSEEELAIRKRDEILSHCAENDKRGRGLVEKVESLVELFDTQSTVIHFKFDDEGGAHVSIADWILDPSEGKRSFSTEDEGAGQFPSIRNVSYDERGGIFEFEVWVHELEGAKNLRETFNFKLERTNYHALDQRIYFGGEITRKRFFPDGRVEVRFGVAKLIDNSN